MGVLANYLRWRGDLSFKKAPFTILDEMVCAGIAYFDISDVYTQGKTLGELLDMQLKKGSIKSTSLDAKDVATEFIVNVALSNRFRSARVIDYEDHYNSDDDVQFAATTLKLDDGTIVVAFRGTDNSLAGWREDFMISFTKPKAQEMALKYLQRNLRWYKKIYVCGHSKGSNLALYAACFLSDKELARVKAVYLNDGPGLCEEVVSKDQVKRIDSITTVIVPEDSVVGRIFEPDLSKKIIVESVNTGLYAHSIYSWKITDNELVRAKDFSKASTFIKNSLDKWLEGKDLEFRKEAVDKIFGIAKESGYERLSDFKEKGLSELLTVFAKKLGSGISNINPKELLLDQVENIKSKIVKPKAEEKQD